jgi:hypothetical protein
MGWVALTWLAAGVLAMAGVGFEAVAWAYLLASMAALAAMLYTLRRLGWGQLVSPMALPGVSAVALALGLWVVGPALVHDLLTLLLVGGVGMVAALAANLWPERSQATGLLKAVNKRREAEVR